LIFSILTLAYILFYGTTAIMFTIKEIIDFAVQIEENGERIYREALSRASNPELASLLKWLADDEAEHATVFNRLCKEFNEQTQDERIDRLGREMLGAVMGGQAFSLEDDDLHSLDRVEEILEKAIEFEKDTVIFYEMLCSFINGTEAFNCIETIIDEEKRHIRVLKEFLEGGVKSFEDIPHGNSAG